MPQKKNILLIGASGGVASAFLKKLAHDRKTLARVVLVDMNAGLPHNRFIPHEDLAYEFIKTKIDVENDLAGFVGLLERFEIHVTVDLSVNVTRPMLDAAEASGVSYLNTGIMNRRGESFVDVVLDLFRRKSIPHRVPHILCAGMNPGIVNLWTRQNIEKFGVPKKIVHFEYDTAQPLSGWLPIITWSRETLLDEIVNDPAGYMDGKDKLRLMYPNPLKNRVSMEDVLRPIMDLEEYPRGFLLLHEENITMAQRYDTPSRFLFAIHPRTMDYLEEIYDRQGRVPVDKLTLGDNREVILKGSVTVGVLLEYEDRRIYTFNTTPHDSITGSSGSCWQVAAGLHGALFALLGERLTGGLYFTEDLFGTSFERLVEENLPVQHREIG